MYGHRGRGSLIYHAMYKSLDNGRTKPRPRKSKTGPGADHVVDENLCLLRASNGKKKISTVVCLAATFIAIWF